MQEIEG